MPDQSGLIRGKGKGSGQSNPFYFLKPPATAAAVFRSPTFWRVAGPGDREELRVLVES